MDLFSKTFTNSLKNVLLYNQYRLKDFMKNELELQIEYLYLLEYKKHFLVLDQEQVKNNAKKIYNLINNFYNGNFQELLTFLEKIKYL